MTNTCLVCAAGLTGFHPIPGGPPVLPRRPVGPTGAPQGPDQGQHRGDLTGDGVHAVDRGHGVGRRRAAQSGERLRAPGDDHARGVAGQSRQQVGQRRLGARQPGRGADLVVSQQDEHEGRPTGLGGGPGEQTGRLQALSHLVTGRGDGCSGGEGGGHRDAEQLPDPHVGRGLGLHPPAQAVPQAGEQLAAQGVDQGAVADAQPRTQGVAGGQGAPGPAHLGRHVGDGDGIDAGQGDQGDRVAGQPAAVEPGGALGGEPVDVRRPARGPGGQPGGRPRGRCRSRPGGQGGVRVGRAGVAERAAAHEHAHREGQDDRDQGGQALTRPHRRTVPAAARAPVSVSVTCVHQLSTPRSLSQPWPTGVSATAASSTTSAASRAQKSVPRPTGPTAGGARRRRRRAGRRA